MANLKLPSGYASSFKKHVVKGKLGAMKSHDYHVLFQQILPLCMGNQGCHHAHTQGVQIDMCQVL